MTPVTRGGFRCTEGHLVASNVLHLRGSSRTPKGERPETPVGQRCSESPHNEAGWPGWVNPCLRADATWTMPLTAARRARRNVIAEDDPGSFVGRPRSRDPSGRTLGVRPRIFPRPPERSQVVGRAAGHGGTPRGPAHRRRPFLFSRRRKGSGWRPSWRQVAVDLPRRAATGRRAPSATHVGRIRSSRTFVRDTQGGGADAETSHPIPCHQSKPTRRKCPFGIRPGRGCQVGAVLLQVRRAGNYHRRDRRRHAHRPGKDAILKADALEGSATLNFAGVLPPDDILVWPRQGGTDLRGPPGESRPEYGARSEEDSRRSKARRVKG